MCGIMKDISGKRFGKLIVIKPTGKKKNNSYLWLCKCDCGKTVIVKSGNLTSGSTQSCGCLRTEKIIKHGGTYERLYKVYNSIKGRCYNKKSPHYKNYGGRGIKICKEWLGRNIGYSNFKKWAINNGYDEFANKGECTIDRIDVNGNYEPSNCRWVNQKTQQNNRRNNKKVTYKNETKTISEWCDILQYKQSGVANLLNKGYTLDEIINFRKNKTLSKLQKEHYHKQEKPFICLETGKIFNSLKEAKEKYNMPNISKHLNGIYKTYKGKHYKFICKEVD